MSRTVLITGAAGMIGRHVAEAHRLAGDEVAGLVRPSEAADAPEGIRVLIGDVTDAASCRAAMDETRPDVVHHYAAQSVNGPSRQIPVATLTANVIGTQTVLEAAAAMETPPAVLVAGSSAAYGKGAVDPGRTRESCPLIPASPYGVSKAAAEMLTRSYALTGRLAAGTVRLFNQVGPGLPAGAAMGRFCRGIARIEAELDSPVLRTGPLSGIRDFSDVRSTATCLVALVPELVAGRWHTVNVCTGEGRTVGEMLGVAAHHARVRFDIRVDEDLGRRFDEANLVGDPARLVELIGHSAATVGARCVGATLDWWRNRVGAGRGAAT